MLQSETVRDSRQRPIRQRLLDTAATLFYQYGIRAVGVERIIETTPTTRATFYRYFPSKEAIIVAYLQQLDFSFRASYAHAVQHVALPKEQLVILFRSLEDWLCRQGYRGCPFIKAAAEYPDPSTQVYQAISAHRAWFAQTVASLLQEMPSQHREQLTKLLVMLRDGAMVSASLDTTSSVSQPFDLVLQMLRDHPGWISA